MLVVLDVVVKLEKAVGIGTAFLFDIPHAKAHEGVFMLVDAFQLAGWHLTILSKACFRGCEKKCE